VAASVSKSRRRSAMERSRGLRASEIAALPLRIEGDRGCERRANRAPSHGGEGSRGVLSSANADDGDGSHARLREQRAQINSVGPSKYELQGPTSKPELSDVSS